MRSFKVVVVAAAALLLAGCSLLPFDNDDPTSGGSEGGGGSGGTGQTPGDDGSGDDGQGGEGDDTGTSTGAGRLPASWPDIVYVPADGQVLNAIESPNNWIAQIGVDDAAAAFTEVSTELKAAGFNAISEVVSPSGSIGVYDNGTYQVQMLANDDSGEPSVYYTIIAKG